MPIALDNGQISATTNGAQKATFSAKKEGTTVSVTRAADAGGVFSFSQAQSIPAGTFDYIRLEGTPLPDKNTIVSTIRLNGKKTGPDASHLSFTVNGIDNGMVKITVYVDGSQALSQTVTLGEGITSGQSAIVPASTTIVPLTTNATITTTPVPTSTNSSKTFFSADLTASLTVQGVDYAGLTNVGQPVSPVTGSSGRRCLHNRSGFTRILTCRNNHISFTRNRLVGTPRTSSPAIPAASGLSFPAPPEQHHNIGRYQQSGYLCAHDIQTGEQHTGLRHSCS